MAFNAYRLAFITFKKGMRCLSSE